MNQSVSIDHPFLPLFNRSWTFEVWIYLVTVTNGIDYPIVEQSELQTMSKCLYLTVRNRKLRIGFFGDDLTGFMNLSASRWYHAAFVYDSDTRNQSIYLDGVLDSTRQANSSYQGTTGALKIGTSSALGNRTYFSGLLDQFSYANRSKTPQEILRDATLTLYYSFDGNSTTDEGPLGINGSLVGNTSFVPGRQSQALQIRKVSDSYVAARGLVLLGRHDQSHSFSIWIKPTVTNISSILHLSSSSNGGGWCLPMLGLTIAGRLISASWDGSIHRVLGPVVAANSWTHAAVTYSRENGLRLYANGSLSNASSPFSFVASLTSDYLFVGSPLTAISHGSWTDINGQYSGVVDELRVYSRELSLVDIASLANPS